MGYGNGSVNCAPNCAPKLFARRFCIAAWSDIECVFYK